MITLYAFGRVHSKVHGLTRDLRAQWALEELELPYHVKGIDHTAGELVRADFTAINPFQQLPVIDDDGFVVTESGAILLYLAEKAGKLGGDGPQGRAEVTRWCFVALTTIEPLVQTIGLLDLGSTIDAAGAEQRAALVKLAAPSLARFEAWLADHEYATGPDFTVADILLTSVLRSARRAGLLAHHPRCETYRARCEARPAWARTISEYEARLGAEPGTVIAAAEPQAPTSARSR